MATLEKRGDFWRVKIPRKGYPAQTRSFDTKAQAERWPRDIESEKNTGIFQDSCRLSASILCGNFQFITNILIKGGGNAIIVSRDWK